MITDGIEMIIVVVWKKALIVVPMPVRNMWCAHTTNDMNPRKTVANDHRLVAPQRLARVVGDDLRHDSHRRQDQHVNLGMRKEPEEVLPQQRVAAAGIGERLTADHETARQEEARAGDAIHELQHGRGFERREGEQQQERR